MQDFKNVKKTTSCTTSFIVIDMQAKLCMFMYINSYVNICVFIISMHKDIPIACRVENNTIQIRHKHCVQYAHVKRHKNPPKHVTLHP